MNDTAYAPGPWRTGSDDAYAIGCDFVEIISGEELTSSYRANAWAVADVDAGLTQEDWANARLIAAAPEMLETLRVTLGNLLSLKASCACVTYDVWIETVEQVIAKATGAA